MQDPQLGLVEAVLGAGSFGTTYRVFSGGRRYAVKAMPAGDPTWREIAVKEVAELEVLTSAPGGCEFTVCYAGYAESPAWQRIVAAPRGFAREGEVVPYFFIYMDYVDTAPMADFLALRDYDLYLAAALDLVEGLAWLHALGFYHRDVKLDNIVYDRARCRAKYIDFGLSCEAAAAGACEPGGSPAYQHPVRGRSVNENSRRDDLWGLGAALYELCHGGEYAYDEAETSPGSGAYVYSNFREPSTPIPELNAAIKALLDADTLPDLAVLGRLLRKAAAQRSGCRAPDGRALPFNAEAEDILQEGRPAFAKRLGVVCGERGGTLTGPFAPDCASLRGRRSLNP